MPDQKETRPLLAVIDGNSLMHRAFHAVPPTMVASDGRPTNAVYGFLSMLLRMFESFQPTHLICAFDKGRPDFRSKLLEQYKAQRPPMDPSLRQQFPMVQELLGALQIPVVMQQGWEGDDILGTLAVKGEQAGYDVFLITGDRDAYQLATDHIKIVTTKKGVSEVVVIGPQEVYELYGLWPDRIPDFYGLKGDTSDNIPGVPGIGEKKAADLLQKYATLDEVIAHADEVKGKMGENLRAHIEDALISRQVATISTDVPLEVELSESVFPAFDPEEVRAAFGELGFTSQTARFLALQGSGSSQKSAADMFALSPVYRDEEARTFIDKTIATGGWAAVTLGSEQAQASLFNDDKILYVATKEGIAIVEGDAVVSTLKSLFERGKVCAHGIKTLIDELIPVDSGQAELMKSRRLNAQRMFDTEIAAYLLDSSRTSYEIVTLCETYLEQVIPAAPEGVSQDMYHAALLVALKDKLEEALKADGSFECFSSIEMALIPALVVLERNGMMLDTDRLKEMSSLMEAELADLSEEVYKQAGTTFNIGSPKQVGVVLFETLQLPVKKKTKTGYSTDSKVLEELKPYSVVPQLILDYREKSKLKNTYLDALPKLIATDGRIHTSYNQTVAATGRLSSSNPNLQNIPVRTEQGRAIRTAFIVGPGNVFLSADYSQIELRLLAHLSEDPHLIQAFIDGNDFHAQTAARVFNVEVSEVTPELRSRAKAVNFGIVYGQQAYGLSQTLNIPFGEAADMIERYFAAYPGVRAYLDETVRRARECGYAETMFGRKRHVRDIFSKNPNMRSFGERTAMNHPMQGSAADIIKLAMIEVQKVLDKGSFESRVIVQVHDELDFECPEREVEEVAALVKEAMQNVVSLRVPLEVSVSTGQTWAEAK